MFSIYATTPKKRTRTAKKYLAVPILYSRKYFTHGRQRGYIPCQKNESVVAAAAKNNNDGEDDNPGAVIVKNTAEAIAIHICLTFQREVFYVRVAVLLPHTLTFYESVIFLLL